MNKSGPSTAKELPDAVKLIFVNSKTSKNKPDPFEGVELSAEMLFRSVFGDKKYYHSAGLFNDPKFFKSEIKKMFKHFISDIDKLQASEMFINGAKHDLGRLEKTLLVGDFTKEKQMLSLDALRPIAGFLGYGIGSKHKSVEPYFIPSVWQEMLGWTNSENYYKNYLKLSDDYRMQIANQLSDQGLTHAEIAVVLNQSGYRIAQLLNKAKAIEVSKE